MDQNTITQDIINQDTLGEVFMGFGGKTLFTLGTVFTSSAVIYGIHKITGWGITCTQSLPFWLGVEEESDEPQILTKNDLFTGIKIMGRISAVILVGSLMKITGNFIDSDNAKNALNQLMYRK